VYLSLYSDWATGWTVRGSNPGVREIFRTCPDRPWGPPSLLYNGYRVFRRGKERPGRDADPSPLLVSWSRKGRAIPLIPLWVARPVQSLNACTRVHFKPLNAELNPICYLLALLTHHFLYVSRIRVKLLTLRLLMSYIYIYIYIYRAPILDVSRSHTTTHHSR